MSTYDDVLNQMLAGAECAAPDPVSGIEKGRGLKVLFGYGVRDPDLAADELSWSELAAHLEAPLDHCALTRAALETVSSRDRKAAKDGPVWMPAELLNATAGRGNDNVSEIHLLVLDIDCGLSLEAVRRPIAHLAHVIHSTFSHSVEKPKWRVVLPLSQPIEHSKLRSAFDGCNAWYDGALDSSCGHDPSRLYYMPRHPSDAASDFVFELNKGAWLDAGLISKAVAPTDSPITRTAPITLKRRSREFESAHEGSRHTALLQLVGALLQQGHGAAQTLDQCRRWNVTNYPPLPDDEVVKVVGDLVLKEAAKAVKTRDEWGALVEVMNSQFALIRDLGIWDLKENKQVREINFRTRFSNTEVQITHKGATRLVTHDDAWMSSPARRECGKLVFEPGKPLFTNGNLNLWTGWGVSPIEGSIEPWSKMLDFAFADDASARTWFEQWVAYPIQNPGEKLNSAVVLWSARQGVGKSLLGETVGKLYGPYFKTIGAEELSSKFNGWAKEAQFVLGEENSSNDRRADSNRLKQLITGGTINVEDKYAARFTLDNRMNFFFTSNSPSALFLEAFDRRFFVWEIAGERLPDDFYEAFVSWRENGGTRHLMAHLLKVSLDGFNPKGNAPRTAAKVAMTDHGKTELERWIHWLSEEDNAQQSIGKEILSCDDLANRFSAPGRKPVSSTAVGRVLASLGNQCERRISVSGQGRIVVHAVANQATWGVASTSAWLREYAKPFVPRTHLH